MTASPLAAVVAERARRISALPWPERGEALQRLSQHAREALRHAWAMWARPAQLFPGSPGAAPVYRGGTELLEAMRGTRELPPPEHSADYTCWLILAGRGYGKTRVGAQFAIDRARAQPRSHGALVAATAADARKTMLSAGLEEVPEASGILAVSPLDFRPVYEPSKRTVTWPNGSVATLYTAEKPGRLRGPQHHWAWVDELAAWSREEAAFDQLLFGLRAGDRPRLCVTTTPRPGPLLRRLLARPTTVVTRGETYDNAANLSPHYLAEIVAPYEGTRLGEQELRARLLEDVPGALWSLTVLDRLRVAEAPRLVRTVVAIDPAVSTGEASAETGIVLAGVGPCLCKGPRREELHGFVLADRSGKHPPLRWAEEAVALVRSRRADRIVAEKNQGGNLVEVNVRTVDALAPLLLVDASQGKRARAEPIASLYEQGRVHHVGALPRLEEQMVGWDPLAAGARSPDRIDALVWALSALMLGADQTARWKALS